MDRLLKELDFKKRLLAHNEKYLTREHDGSTLHKILADQSVRMKAEIDLLEAELKARQVETTPAEDQEFLREVATAYAKRKKARAKSRTSKSRSRP
jgi:hypothetical protein